MAADFAEPANGWVVTATPYGWMLNFNGDTGLGGVTTSVDVSFKEIVENADTLAALEGRMEARNGRFSLLSLSDYFKATFSGEVKDSVQPIPQLNIDIDAGVQLDFELILSEVSATYEVFKHWTGGGMPAGAWDAPQGFIALDVLAGGRYNSIDVDADIVVDVAATLTPEIIPVSITETGQLRARIQTDQQWVDPFVGLRLRLVSGKGYAFYARGDIGGFGAGSEFVWQAMAGIAGQCWCNENLSWAVGYRALDTDYESGSGRDAFLYDMLVHGPVIGATYRF